MTKILPVRGTTTEINNTPIVDGQILFETDNANGCNHIYMDVEMESDFITNSPYYINNTGICMTLNVSNIVPYIDINKINNGEAYMALVYYGFQYATPMLISNNPNTVTFRFIPTQTSGEGTGGDVYEYSDTCEYNDTTWYISHGANIQHSSILGCIPNNISINFATTNWSEIGYYFLQRIYENINSQNLIIPQRVSLGIYDWSQILNKPFETIGNNLSVIDGVLDLSNPISATWTNIVNKPFSTIGNGLYVENNKLNACVEIADLNTYGTASATQAHYQEFYILYNGTPYYTTLNGTTYLEYSQTLSTTNNTVYTFNNIDITSNSAIDVFTSIWGVNPISINVTTGTCTVTFEPHTESVNMTCRIYVK